MLNANNEINIKKEERKYSWSTVFAWLYLKTIGRILPKRWNRWAENILYYDKATANNEVQTDAFKTVDESAQVDLKPEVAEKESQSEIMSKDGEVQTDRVTFQDMTIQTEYVEKANKNIEVDLKPEIAEKESQSEIMSKDGGVQTDEVAFQDTAMQTECVEKIDKSVEVNLKSEVAEKESQRKLKNENEKLKGELEGANQALKAFIGLCNDQAQQIANLQTGNDLLEEENGELKSKLAELEKSYRELAEVVDKRGEEFLAKLKERSETIVRSEGELIKLSAEFANKTRKLSVEGEEKDAKINSLTLLNEALKQDIKEIETRSNEQQQMAEIYMKLNELLSNVTEISERTSQLHNQEQQEEKKSLENKALELQKQAQTLEGNKEWELAGIDGILKEVFSNTMEILEKGLYAAEGRNESLKRQLTAQSVKIEELNKQLEKVTKELEKLTLSYSDQVHQIEELQLENDFLEEQNGELRSRNRKLESEVVHLKEELIQSKVELASGIMKGFEDSERKCMKTGSLTLLDEELSASVEKLSDQLYKVRSIERQQSQNTQGSKQQLEGETIDLEGKLKIEQSQKEQKQEEKDAQYKEQLNENQHALGNLEHKLESLESQSTTVKVQQRKDSFHQANMKSMAKSEADLSHEKKASFVKKRKNNLYNEEFVQPYTNSLPEDALEKSIKAKAKSLGSSNVQKLAKNISNKFMSPKNTNSTPNSFMSHTNNIAHVLLSNSYSRPLA